MNWRTEEVRVAMELESCGILSIRPTYHKGGLFDGLDKTFYFRTWDVVNNLTGYALITNLYSYDNAKDFAEQALNLARSEIYNLHRVTDVKGIEALRDKLSPLLDEYSAISKRHYKDGEQIPVKEIK